jgi:3-phytase
VIVGTDKKGGLATYDLSGNEMQYLPDGEMNNVDVAYGFPFGGGEVDIVAATNRTDNSVVFYTVDSATGMLQRHGSRAVSPGIDVLGVCTYHSPASARFYIYVTGSSGVIEQWEVFDEGGALGASLRRTFDVGGKTEGCVVDGDLGHLYVAEERKGIWKYGAEPEDGLERVLVDRTGPKGKLKADVEGLALYYAGDGTGYLLASSQGNDRFVVYTREGDNRYVMTFQIVSGGGVDGISRTDGIEVTSMPLGAAFPQGVFIAQDDSNDDGNQNFKLVPWQDIAGSRLLPLTVDASWDPRGP